MAQKEPNREVRMAKKLKKRFKVVTMERYTDEVYRDKMLIRVSSGGIATRNSYKLRDLLEGIDGVEICEIVVMRFYVQIRKHDDAEWPTIIPTVKKVLTKVFGRGVRITERMQLKMSEDVAIALMEASAGEFRETFRNCALTEDECEAFGIDFHQHNNELRGVGY